jgi:hypothetical protein
MPESLYSDDDAEEILKLASRRSMDGTVTRQKLLETAAELGISPEAVEEAEQALQQNREETAFRSEFDRRRRTGFLNELVGAVLTCTFLAFVNYFTEGRLDWVFWVILGLGFKVAKTGWEVFGESGDDYDKAFRKWKIKKGFLPKPLELEESDADGAHDRVHDDVYRLRMDRKERLRAAGRRVR